MLAARFVSIVAWPGAVTRVPRRAIFSATYVQTLDTLEAELKFLRAGDILIQTFHDASDIRNDGWPRSSARSPRKAGVIVTFTPRGGQVLSFPCDSFTSWEHNLRAVALSLEALRKVDRYGVTRSNEQYKGFAALPAPEERVLTPEHAANILAPYLGADNDAAASLAILHGRFSWRLVKNAAFMATHPDKTGMQGDFLRVQAAIAVLEKHFAAKGS